MKPIYYAQVVICNDMKTMMGYEEDLGVPEAPVLLTVQNPSGSKVQNFYRTFHSDEFCRYETVLLDGWNFILYPGKEPIDEDIEMGYATDEMEARFHFNDGEEEDYDSVSEVPDDYPTLDADQMFR